MSHRDKIREILGFDPPDTRTLDHLATHQSSPSKPAAFPEDTTSGIEITEDFKKAMALIEEKAPAIFITGRAGTGKSTFIQLIRKRYEGVMAVVAPTGVAAQNAGGVTIHSFFRFPPRIINPDDIKKVVDNRLYKRLEILVVDEVSMVRADVMDAMDQCLRLNGRCPDSPFGGIQLAPLRRVHGGHNNHCAAWTLHPAMTLLRICLGFVVILTIRGERVVGDQNHRRRHGNGREKSVHGRACLSRNTGGHYHSIRVNAE